MNMLLLYLLGSSAVILLIVLTEILSTVKQLKQQMFYQQEALLGIKTRLELRDVARAEAPSVQEIFNIDVGAMTYEEALRKVEQWKNEFRKGV